MRRHVIASICIVIAFAAEIAVSEDDPQQYAADMLKAMGLATAYEKSGDIDVIGWRDLAKLLPKEIAGMEKGKIEGGTFTMGGNMGSMMPDSLKGTVAAAGLADSYSSAARTYTQELDDGGRKTITVRVMDAGIARAMLAPFLIAVEYDTPDGIMKSVEINGHPARLMQTFDEDLNVTETQYMVLVGDRVLVQFEGNENADQSEVEAQMKGFPWDDLAAMTKTSVESKEPESE